MRRSAKHAQATVAGLVLPPTWRIPSCGSSRPALPGASKVWQAAHAALKEHVLGERPVHRPPVKLATRLQLLVLFGSTFQLQPLLCQLHHLLPGATQYKPGGSNSCRSRHRTTHMPFPTLTRQCLHVHVAMS
eukprot:GHRQ01032213.1.p1 GENE.GHRQ01032213.1~~GHRQ01032213.1.p1  ORF type:complete len:132 (-),score=16.27 GHRQ01032213.1:70-465(-)